MAWTVPQYTPQEVNAAGKALGKMAFPVDLDGLDALGVINNWRSSHAYARNDVQATWECYLALKAKYDAYGLDQPLQNILSEASIGKGVLRTMKSKDYMRS